MRKSFQILIILTLARMTMGFQFQSIAALGPLLTESGILSYSELGILIGIYLLPGAFLAIPGAWLGSRFGQKRVVLIGLGMMVFGGILLAFSVQYSVLIVARLFSGIGAILLNVLISKMVADWFVKERIATAMGIVISSWPLGIAIALLTIGLLQESIGLLSTQLVPAVLCAIAFIMISRLYTSPPTSTQSTQPINEQSGIRFSNTEFIGIVLSGLIWCFYNVALILLLSFGAEYLVSNGLALITANATVSLTSWLIIPAIPLGAWLAEKYERQVVTMVISFITVALLALLIPFTSSHLVLFALLGIAFGPAAGLIMALPAKILSEQNRAMGMGVFWTIYYIGMGVFPSLGGYLRESTNNPAAPIYLACTIILMTLPLLAAQQFLQQRQPVKN